MKGGGAIGQETGVRAGEDPHAGGCDPRRQGQIPQVHQRDRNGLEDLSESSGQRFITVVNGTAAGGGYELALATDHIMLADDGAAAVSLPEVPLLAVLPGTGGLTRVVDKRKVRRDHADFFCTIEEGIKGKRAVAWRLVDEIVPSSKLEGKVADRAKEFAAASKRNGNGKGIALSPLNRTIDDSGIRYGFVNVDIDRAARIATISIKAPEAAPPADIDGLVAQGASFWPLQVARELDDAILHLRINELETAMLLFKSHGDTANVVACDTFLEANKAHWLVNEIRHYWKRVSKRIDVTSRTLVTLVEPGSCFAGTLAELVFAADRSYMLIGSRQGDNRAPPALQLTAMNFGPYPMCHGLTRLQSRFQADPSDLERAEATIGTTLMPKRPKNSASSPSRSTTSTGMTRCGCSWRNARPSRPTASPAWKRICASSGRRPWNRKSSRASRRGRTGSSSAPTRSAKTARCAATAPARRRSSI